MTLRRPVRTAARMLACGALFALAIGAAAPAAVRADDLCGCWSGTWHDCSDDHQGIIKAEITPCGPNKYRAVFHGWAFKIMPYRYVAYLTGHVDPETGKTVFCCTMRIGVWGSYHMRGYAKGCKFFARYRAGDHTGYFKMTRVECKR